MDDERADEGAQVDRGVSEDPGAVQVPAMTQQAAAPIPDAPIQPPVELTGTAALSADLTAAWSNLDQTAKLLVRASAAALILVVIGVPLSVWDSAPFALLLMTACVITIITAWFGRNPAVRSMPIPVSTIELGAGLTATVLAVLKVLEMLFDVNRLANLGGIIGLILAIGLAIAAVIILVVATRRGADLRAAAIGGDGGALLAVLGLVLVLLGWAFNLTLSFWTMGQAALPLAVLTIAALAVAEAPRVKAPFPVAWVGAAIGAFGLILAFGNWNDLLGLGRTELELNPGDFLGLVVYTVGAILIIAGGVLSALAVGRPEPAPTDEPTGEP